MTAADIVSQHPCPPAVGRHEWIWFVACLCHEQGVGTDEAEVAIRAGLSRDETPNEVSSAVSSAYAREGATEQKAYMLDGKRVFKKDLVYSLSVLQQTVKDTPSVNRDWLRDRSPVWAYDGLSFINLLYKNDESVLVFDRMDSRIPALKVQGQDCYEWKRKWVPVDRASVIEGLATCHFPNGVWFLAQPVTGDWTAAGPGIKPTCRSRENVTAFRWLVLESDQAPEGEWLRLLVTLPGVAAIYTSGGKSIHALLRLDSQSKIEFDSVVAAHKPKLITLGADPAAMTAVRLTRLPWAWRGDKRQELLYLNPAAVPGGKAIYA